MEQKRLKRLRYPMNKTISLFGGILCFLLTGCLALSGNYTPNDEIQTVDTKKQFDITYSFDYISFITDDTQGIKERCSNKIKEYLEESGAFKTVSYRDFSARSKYHILFLARQSFATDSGTIELAGLSLFLLPGYEHEYYDFSAILILNNEIVCAPSTCERMRTWYWLPLLPALVYPPVFTRKSIEKKCLRYLINEILEKNKELIKNPLK